MDICKVSSRSGNMCWCHSGSHWVLPPNYYYLFLRAQDRAESKEKSELNALQASKRFRIVGEFCTLPQVVNILVRINCFDPQFVVSAWIPLYMGPERLFPEFINPLGNCEAPF